MTINSPGSQWENDRAGTLEYFIKPSGLEYFITFCVTHHIRKYFLFPTTQHELGYLYIYTEMDNLQLTFSDRMILKISLCRLVLIKQKEEI